MRSCQQIKNGIHGHQNWVVMLKTIFPAENYKYIIFVVIRAPNQSKSTNFLFTDSQNINFCGALYPPMVGNADNDNKHSGRLIPAPISGGGNINYTNISNHNKYAKIRILECIAQFAPLIFWHFSSFLWYFFAIQISYSGGGVIFSPMYTFASHSDFI